MKLCETVPYPSLEGCDFNSHLLTKLVTDRDLVQQEGKFNPTLFLEGMRNQISVVSLQDYHCLPFSHKIFHLFSSYTQSTSASFSLQGQFSQSLQ